MPLDERTALLRELFHQALRPLGTRRHALSALQVDGWLESADTNQQSPMVLYGASRP